MKSNKHKWIIIAIFGILLSINPKIHAFEHEQNTGGMPQLVKNGNVTQLYVDGKPFLIVGGELNNSTSSKS